MEQRVEIKEWECRVGILEAVKRTMQSQVSSLYATCMVEDILPGATYEKVKLAVQEDIEEIDRKIHFIKELNEGGQGNGQQ